MVLTWRSMVCILMIGNKCNDKTFRLNWSLLLIKDKKCYTGEEMKAEIRRVFRCFYTSSCPVVFFTTSIAFLIRVIKGLLGLYSRSFKGVVMKVIKGLVSLLELRLKASTLAIF